MTYLITILSLVEEVEEEEKEAPAAAIKAPTILLLRVHDYSKHPRSSKLWCSPVPAPPTDTRADPASTRRAAEAARGRVGRAGGPLWCGPSLGALGFSHRATI